MDVQQGLSILGRGVAAAAAVKVYRASLLLLADLAEAEAARQTGIHGADDPLSLVYSAAARCNRSAAASLDECAAVVDARVVADVHAAAAYVAGATSSYAQSATSSGGMADFASRMRAALERGHLQFESAANSARGPGGAHWLHGTKNDAYGVPVPDVHEHGAAGYQSRAYYSRRQESFSEAPLFRAWNQCVMRARYAASRWLCCR